MFDSLPHTSKAFVVGGGKPAAKLSLNGQLDAQMWDAIFGAGTHETLSARMRTSPADAFTRQGWFRKCADVRAKGVASLPWGVYPVEAEAGDYEAALWTDADPRPPDDLEALADLRRCLYLAEASLALSGRCYFGKMLDGMGVRNGRLGRFSGLSYWSPYSTTPEWDARGLTFRRVVNGKVIEGIDPEQVVYAWQPDPLVEMGPGSSDGNAAAHNAAVLDALARFLGDHIDGGLIKMTVLATEDGHRITEDQASKARSAWGKFLRGIGLRNGPPVLNNIKPHVIGEGLKELANEVLTREQRESIATTFGIPWSVLMSSAANYATATVEERGFMLRTTIPQAEIVEGAINDHLLSDYDLTLRMEPERSEVMQQFELEKAEKVAIICGGPVLTKNEGRRLLGYEERPEMEMDEVEDEPEGGDGAAVDVEARGLPVPSLSEKLDRLIGEGV